MPVTGKNRKEGRAGSSARLGKGTELKFFPRRGEEEWSVPPTTYTFTAFLKGPLTVLL
jgi:hypothetical protein